jgi:hypothetical protein
MYEQVLGNWPTHDKFILVSCDEKYLNKYFARFYKTFTAHWSMPIHAHVIDPSVKSLSRLKEIGVSHTWCDTEHYDWQNEVGKYRDTIKDLTNQDKQVKQWLYECYCQCQRFVLLGSKMSDGQSVVVADVDAYAQHEPNKRDIDYLFDKTCFSRHNNRLMATLCHFHPRDMVNIKEMAKLVVDQLKETYVLGMDQLAIKKVFGNNLDINILDQHWIRHEDVKSPRHLAEHQSCLIYHEKGTRGKQKGIQIEWTDI